MTTESKNSDLPLENLDTTPTKRQAALFVRRACKTYGFKTNTLTVLDELDMTVPKGCIYGLLGASGCGKTTLLNCVVGRKILNSGDIWVLGRKPGSKASGVLGPRIGYMPQDTGLLDSFTIRETFKYFGWLSNMTSKEIAAKINFFIEFLMLPDADSLVQSLSGGQKRRVSLAIALQHEPELLILDEPTVGIDPLLRTKIWNYLLELTSQQKKTVILTTHYIEETKQADLIGLMRGGYLVAEESPDYLLSQYNTQNLEDVFLKLSILQDVAKERRSNVLNNASSSIDINKLSGGYDNEAMEKDETKKDNELSLANTSTTKETSKSIKAKEEIQLIELTPEDEHELKYRDYCVMQSHHMTALVWKNFLWMRRNLSILCFVIAMPLNVMALCCWSVGGEPKNLSMSVVNRELKSREHCETVWECNSTKLSCNYFEYIIKNHSMHLDYFENEEEAKDMVRKGNSWAALVVQHNFSDALRNRFMFGNDVAEENLLASTISIYQDKSNEIIGNHVATILTKEFLIFFKSYLISCGENSKLVDSPIRLHKPIYGENLPSYRDFIIPGILLSGMFFMAVMLTYGSMLTEINEGTLERSLINGVTCFELLISQGISSAAVITCQTVLLLGVSFAVFDLKQEGNWIVLSSLVLLTGICGMSYGFIVTCTCDNERAATYLAMGSFLPLINLSGMIWPLEAMNDYLRILTSWVPLTISTNSLRSIMARGWGISDPVVYNGFISTIGWTLLFSVVSLLLLNYKKGWIRN